MGIIIRSWNPLDAKTLPYAWYDYSDFSTITFNGSWISQLDDKSGNGYHVTQATAAKQPLYVSNVQNGHSAAYFDGNKDMSVDSPNFSMPVTCFVVCKWDNVEDDAQVALGNYSGRGELQASSTLGVFLYNGVAGQIAPAITRLSWGLYNYEISGALEKYWINGGSEGSVNAGNTTLVWNGTIIGNWSGLLQGMKGYIGEVLIYEGGIPEADRLLIQSYLLTKWSIS